jgi:Domain of unknown function (DUF4920)
MKNLSVTLLLCVGIISLAVGQPPSVPANEGSIFGAGTTAENAVAVDQLPQLLKDKESASVKVLAKVIDVCPKKGCWMSLEMPDKSTVFVKMKDYAFFVPLAMIGKTVVIDAEAKTIETSVDELKHYAEDAKKSKEEIDAITAPKKEIRLMANGILVVR